MKKVITEPQKNSRIGTDKKNKKCVIQNSNMENLKEFL